VLAIQRSGTIRQSLIASGGNRSPLSVAPNAASLFVVVAALLLFYPMCARRISQRRTGHGATPTLAN